MIRFDGYRRQNGTVGIRNHILIFPTVICASAIAQKIHEAIPGTVYVTHPHGCGHLGDDKEHMIRTMAGYCSNPNVGGVVLVGLGCELITPEVIAERLGKAGQRFKTLSIQAEGGTRAAIQKGQELAQRLLKEASSDRREPVDVSELILGVKCGGSDAFSGLTANPALGIASDMLIQQNGTVIMTEVPEMIGAEQVLKRRAGNEQISREIDRITGTMEASILRMGVDVRGSEPSPGNIAGGLTTLEEKSQGAILKGGTSPIKQVVRYAEKPSEKGLIIMDGPALDAVCITGMLAAGAQIIAFTTGRGSPLGTAIAPVIKIATNSSMYHHMQDDMDLNAGEILDGSESLQGMGQKIFQALLVAASGKPARTEHLGHQEFAIHSIGPAI